MPSVVLLLNHPSERRCLECSAAAGAEKPPAPHVHLGAVGGHDVQVRGALGAGDEPGGNSRPREQLGDDAPKQIDHGESLPGHARAVEWGSSELLQKAPADPANYGDGLAVADRLVAGTVRAFTGWLAAPGDPCVVIGKALASLPLDHTGSAHSFGFQHICLSIIERAPPLVP